ncbi:MAG: hypothetical protein ABJ215_18160 [Alphaproteobacteria bacterium]
MVIAGAKNWKKRFESFDTQIKSNPFYEEYIVDRFPLEISLQDFLSWRKSTGRNYRVPIDADEAALFGFIGMTSRIHQRLSSQGKVRLEGAIRDALKNDSGLAPVAFEFVVAAHLMHRGFSVEFVDLEGTEKFDLLCERDGSFLEVECKNLSGDAGRPIHRKRLVQLGAAIQNIVGEDRKREAGIELVKVTLEKRLEGRTEHQLSIANAVAESLRTQTGSSGVDGFSVEYRLVGPVECPEIPTIINPESVSGLRSAVESLAETQNANIVFNITPGHGVTAVVVDSQADTRIMDYLAERTKEAASDQLSGLRSGMVCVRFVDMSDQQLHEIAEVEKSTNLSALQHLASDLLSREDWSHIHKFAFFARGDANVGIHQSSVIGDFSSTTGGSVYHFKNKGVKYTDFSGYSIF